jgi:hypothetical protein
MKKSLSVLLLAVCISFSTQAQDKETKVKQTSTPTQKVHNTFSKHKRHNGYKAKNESNGVESKAKVNTTTGEVKAKKDK